MLELAILGFLAEGPLHGYELKRRVVHLTGHARPVSDGTLYPAIKRMHTTGLIDRTAEPGAGAGPTRYVLSVTDAGRAELVGRLARPAEQDITDFTRFAVILAFLSQLPDLHARRTVLSRRLAFLEQPASFFYDDHRALRAEDVTDTYRQGLLTVARATSKAERAWLTAVLATDAAQ
ncbi:PadR family transcriptional regulator [Rhodococcoides corynebacterioides]|uniref:PadR family transcriptional regulator n=1 Tax=Rhodococcoides corynebacterioides TaxID=53972 RepID=UPI003AE59738